MRLAATQVQGQALAAFAVAVAFVCPSNPEHANRLSASSGILADDREACMMCVLPHRLNR